MFRKNVIVMILLFAAVVGCLIYYGLNRAPEKIVKQKDGWKTLKYRAQKYLIDYPGNWKLNKEKGNYCIENIQQVNGATSSTSVCVVVEDNKKGLDYNDFFGVENLKDFAVNSMSVGKYKLPAESYVSIKGASNLDEKRTFNIETILVARGDKMYSLNIMSQQWQKDRKAVERVIGSFEFE